MIEWDKRKEGKSNSTSDYIREMENAVDDLCERLSKDSKETFVMPFFSISSLTLKEQTVAPLPFR